MKILENMKHECVRRFVSDNLIQVQGFRYLDSKINIKILYLDMISSTYVCICIHILEVYVYIYIYIYTIQIAFEKFKNGDVDTIAGAWSAAIQVMYLDPVGILPNRRFSWSVNTVNDIKQRNPSLQAEEFLLPANISWPYPIIGMF
jgi:hypothetical protein